MRLPQPHCSERPASLHCVHTELSVPALALRLPLPLLCRPGCSASPACSQTRCASMQHIHGRCVQPSLRARSARPVSSSGTQAINQQGQCVHVAFATLRHTYTTADRIYQGRARPLGASGLRCAAGATNKRMH